MTTCIPVIDLFAGPGGLSEGFASIRNAKGSRAFQVRLSVEKDETAHQTLELRAFFRSFDGHAPDQYYDYLNDRISKEELYGDRFLQSHLKEAQHEAWHHTLSAESHREVSKRVRQALGTSRTWVLIGGPPCQAYSLVGRSRMRSADPRGFERDERHFLYKEYLRILAEHAPPVFIMENVKGLLSATIRGRSMFGRILEDLSKPNGSSLRYRIVALGGQASLFGDSEDYVIRSERYGIPQARHRVILCGIREDIPSNPEPLSPEPTSTPIEWALHGLPAIRSRLSDQEDSHAAWLAVMRHAAETFKAKGGKEFRDVWKVMADSVRKAKDIQSTGKHVSSYTTSSTKLGGGSKLEAWYRDPKLGVVSAHESRSHMASDLQRYLFAAAYSAARGRGSPKLSQFPTYLLPKHRNARARGQIPFDDRFRVQSWAKPATTIVSHIAKDGHYYIHPDPAQCRSLTVREAARLQTFPDNYRFEGNRTQQYHQVGNAVPPLLAQRIAQRVYDLLSARVREDDATDLRVRGRAVA